MDLQKTGRSISSLRKEHDWTQKDLAERVGVTDKAVSRWETGRGSPDVSYLTALADVLEVSISELVLGERIGSTGKNPAEIVEQVDQAVVDTLEFSRENAVRDRAAAAGILLVGTAILLCVLGVVYKELILFWSDIPVRYLAYALLLFIIIPVGAPALIHRIPSECLRLDPFKTYLSASIASFLLVMMGTALLYPEFYMSLTDLGALRYDFDDTVVYEVLFKLLPLDWALTVSVNTIYVAFQTLRLKKRSRHSA